MRIVAISDTHGMHDRLALPDGDVLVHAGDFSAYGRADEIAGFDGWAAGQPFRRVVVIAGNHDRCLERMPITRRLFRHCTYLCDEAVEIEGVRFYGSPWQPEFMDWAFNLPRGEPLRRKWARIPRGTEVLVTHGPPAGIGDRTLFGKSAGCADLRDAIERVQPALHLFGHIHEGSGTWPLGAATCINATTCDAAYRLVNPPWVIDLERGERGRWQVTGCRRG